MDRIIYSWLEDSEMNTSQMIDEIENNMVIGDYYDESSDIDEDEAFENFRSQYIEEEKRMIANEIGAELNAVLKDIGHG